MIWRLLPALLAVVALADTAQAIRRANAGAEAFARLRHAVRVDPTEARAEFCAGGAANPSCDLELLRGRPEDPGPACPEPWEPGPPRHYTVRLRCRLPRWVGGIALPLLEARLFR